MDTPFPAYRGNDPYIFVCYAHADADAVYPEIAWLHEEGLNVWYDNGISPGANWRAEIGTALVQAKKILFYISRNSLASNHCNRELNLALDEDKEIIPVYLEDVELTPDLKVGIARLQALHRESGATEQYRASLLAAVDIAEKTPRPEVRASDLAPAAATHAAEPAATPPQRPPVVTYLIVASITAVFALLLVEWWLAARDSGGPQPNTAQLTANPIERSLTSMSISPDGAYMAYTTPAGLFVQTVAARDIHQVKLGTGIRPTTVYWFPDGSRLLLIGSRDDRSRGLWSISPFGGAPLPIGSGVARAAISPDGRYIAYIPDAGDDTRFGRQVWLMGPNGESPGLLLDAGDRDIAFELAWSPDSARIAVGLWSTGEGTKLRNTRIETFDLTGEDRRELLASPRLFQNWTGVLPFAWCGQDKFVFAQVDDPLTSNLWSLGATPDGLELSGEPRQLTRWLGINVRGISSTRDCRSVAALLVQNQADVYVATLARDGRSLASERKVTFDLREDRAIGWSPDSSQLLIRSSRQGDFHFYRSTGDFEGFARIAPSTNVTPEDPTATWTPDGASILYTDDGDIRRVPAAGGAPVVVAEGAHDSIRCVPGSPRCVAAHRADDAFVFKAFDPQAGSGDELARVASRLPFTKWALSPDGLEVAVVYMDDDFVHLTSLVSSETRSLAVKGWRHFEYVSWSADGEAVFINAGFSMSGEYAALLRVGLDGGVEVLRERPNEWHVYPHASPDGKRLAFSVMRFLGNAWLISNF